MNDMREALKKAGLINEKADRRLKHEDRVRNKKLGREGLQHGREQREKDRAEQTARKKSQVKDAQEQHSQREEKQSRWKQIQARMADEQVRKGLSGPRRFHYRDAQGYLPYLQISDAIGRRLEAGELAIVHRPGTGAIVVPRALATDIESQRPELVFHLAGSSP